MTLKSFFLGFAAVGLLPIALSYGLAPRAAMRALYGLELPTPNGSHIFRAVMGLYLAMIVLWTLGAYDPVYQFAALVSVAVFMLGLAAGRLLSLLVDGMPHFLLFVYFVLEVVLGVIALMLLRGIVQ
ncbi:DUF4345 domain-containing protein [Polycladidibacter hongkongensis]|uniref:DUF4345 domain-containing protein n=1 Tax=Polycladidibacter hongkongensis TaxID=1647556 RepID=UPI000836BFA2|nr:DUF4345 domain-containing protein [Pseudovibrio hongkongensis]